ncbi:MAG: T9SS type A sorting domain-containing protein [Bacteroidia bacterium]|nr:T9SS type A sorting domain-containing protein [Bacteroidia bacterium]
MKYSTLLRNILLLALAGFSFSARAQAPSLEIQSLSGFPDVVNQNSSYTLQAYIVNTGSGSFSGNPQVWISFNNGTPEKITGGWSPSTTLNPGDSVLWQKNGYNFTSSAIVTGLNDILVWPESPGVVTSDTAEKQIVATESACFKLNKSSVSGISGSSFSLTTEYDLDLVAFNLGSSANNDPVNFWAQLDEEAPVLLDDVKFQILPGESCSISLNDFRLKHFINDNWPFNYCPSKIRFFAQELPSVPPADSANFAIDGPVGIDGNLNSGSGLSIYPVPARNFIRIDPQGLKLTNASCQLLDMTGRQLQSWEVMPSEIRLNDYPAGTYFLKVTRADAQPLVRKFVKY